MTALPYIALARIGLMCADRNNDISNIMEYSMICSWHKELYTWQRKIK